MLALGHIFVALFMVRCRRFCFTQNFQLHPSIALSPRETKHNTNNGTIMKRILVLSKTSHHQQTHTITTTKRHRTTEIIVRENHLSLVSQLLLLCSMTFPRYVMGMMLCWAMRMCWGELFCHCVCGKVPQPDFNRRPYPLHRFLGTDLETGTQSWARFPWIMIHKLTERNGVTTTRHNVCQFIDGSSSYLIQTEWWLIWLGEEW